MEMSEYRCKAFVCDIPVGSEFVVVMGVLCEVLNRWGTTPCICLKQWLVYPGDLVFVDEEQEIIAIVSNDRIDGNFFKVE